MYPAIVFQPLLGAILAGAIALVGGARTRAAELASLVAAGGGGGGHGHHGDDHGHADHGAGTDLTQGGDEEHIHHLEEARPQAPGVQAAELITTIPLLITAVLSWIAFVEVGFGLGGVQRIEIMRWIGVGALDIHWALRIDTLTAVMLVVVTTVSSLVHVYSIGYMRGDKQQPRFFAYLSLFTFAMLMLVTSDNIVQLFFGWEGVGLASYLLIGFWYLRPAANAAAIKAFVVNRVGDFGFALGIFGIFALFGTVSFDTIFADAPGKAQATMSFLGWAHPHALTVICLLLFTGAMGKSAQFFLHTWLPDAMEGPTPVSALIHAATMVTAGVFMVARLSPLFEWSTTALAVVTFIGATTAFFAATVGLVQNDIKKVIAYSTCSQLGYMFVALGVGVYSAGIFHLFTHAFFKALLFLAAGSVIVAMHHEQDMRKMGGLRRLIPVTYWCMIAGTLSLTGFPFTAGYYSKDGIIEAALAAHSGIGMYGAVLTEIGAALTSFYSWRLIFMTFHGAPRAPLETMRHVKESPYVMLVPLILLSIGALGAGAGFEKFFVGEGHDAFWKHALFTGANNHVLELAHQTPFLIGLIPTLAMIGGFAVAWWFYIYDKEAPVRLAREHDLLYRFLLNKWYFDEIYDFLFVRGAKALGRFLWKRGDGTIIDGLGPDGISARVLDVTRGTVRLQSGYLYHYAFAMLIGLAAIFTWFIFAA
jgi:NADH-quinone oxidoreductase subunit L